MNLNLRSDLIPHNDFNDILDDLIEKETGGPSRKVKPSKRSESKLMNMFSNSLEDSCKVKCKVCDKEMLLYKMRKHSLSVHCLSVKEYEEIYGQTTDHLVKKTFHECRICGNVLLLDSFEVGVHLKKQHKIAWKEYNKNYPHVKLETKDSILGKTHGENNVGIKKEAEADISRGDDKEVKLEKSVKLERIEEIESYRVLYKSLNTKQLLAEIDRVLAA